MKKILVPVDFSKYAVQATRASVHLAQVTGAKVIFLHNVFTEKNWESLPLHEQMEDGDTFRKNIEGNKKLKALLKSALVKKIDATGIITFGVTYEQITLQAKHLNVDLILIGSHANENPEQPFIGSTIQRVLRVAVCPVLMVKKDFRPKAGMKIAVATDLDDNNRKAFEKIKRLLVDLRASAYLVFINRPKDFLNTRAIEKAMDRFAKRYPSLKFHKVIYNHTDVDEGLLQFAEDNHMNCIALITRNRKDKPKYLIGNTEIIGLKFPKPVLSVNILPEPYPMN